MDKKNRPVTDGVWAGVVGASVLALFFLGLDLFGGHALETPRFVAGVLLDRGMDQVTPVDLILFSVLHVCAFVVVGFFTGLVLERLPSLPTLFLGFVLGFLLFDAVFYAGLLRSGVHVVAEIGWPEVLIGNVLACLGITVTLDLRRGRRGSGSRKAAQQEGFWNEGILAGLLGAGLVAGWFFVVDLVMGRPLLTPSALGSAVFLGVDALADVQITTGTVLGYTAVHLALFVVAGLLGAGFVRRAEEMPHLIFGGMLLFVSLETVFVGYLAIAAEFLLGALAWWAIALGNLLAAAGMGAFFLRRHPRLRRILQTDLPEEAWSSGDDEPPAFDGEVSKPA